MTKFQFLQTTAARTPCPPSRRSGLTLLELIVVIGVIAVLATLLMPAVSRLSSGAKQAQCTGNLKQIVTAYLTRVTDDGGVFPPSRTRRVYDEETGGTDIPSGAFLHDMLREYITSPTAKINRPGAVPGDAGVYWCPGRDPGATSLTTPGGQGPHYSYAHNTELGGTNAQPTTAWLGPEGGSEPNPNFNPALARLAAVPRPSQIMVVAEQAHPGRSSAGHLLSSSWPFSTSADETPPASGRQIDFTRHNGGANAAFLDGSVRRMTFEDLHGTRTTHLIPEP